MNNVHGRDPYVIGKIRTAVRNNRIGKLKAKRMEISYVFNSTLSTQNISCRYITH